MKITLNSVIALLLGVIAFLIMNQFNSGDWRFIVPIWVTMVSAVALNLYVNLKKKK